MTRRKTSLLAATGLVALALLWLATAYYYPSDLGDRRVSVIIEPGDTFDEVADSLLEGGVVRSSIVFRTAARLMHIDRKLTPGRYDFTGRNSCRAVLRKLREADFLRVRVTVPEGSPIWRVAAILNSRVDMDSATIMRLNTDSAFLASLELPYLEGYLFPETYFFKWGIPESEALAEMVAMFRRQTDSLWPEQLPLGLTREEAVVLASIVEAETMLEEENPIVASVYSNRLKRRMKLDADPTVIYGLGGLDRPLYRKDLRKDTPYNTYRRRGLPPTPINSPSLSAIRAVLSPADTDYLYFVADGSGGHIFSRSNAEHNRARRRIKATQNDKDS